MFGISNSLLRYPYSKLIKSKSLSYYNIIYSLHFVRNSCFPTTILILEKANILITAEKHFSAVYMFYLSPLLWLESCQVLLINFPRGGSMEVDIWQLSSKCLHLTIFFKCTAVVDRWSCSIIQQLSFKTVCALHKSSGM